VGKVATVSHMRATLRTTVVAVAVLLGVLGMAGAATALESMGAVAAALKQSPVYNDPAAERALSASETDELLAEVRSAGTPLYIAVVPQSFMTANGGSPSATLSEIARAVDRPGTYALVAGNSFIAASSISGLSVGPIANQALADQKGNGTYAVLSQFVAGVAEQARTGDSSSTSGSGSGSSESGFPWGWVIIGGGAAALGGAITYSVRKSRRQQAEQLAAVRKVVDEDVTTFGEQVAAFDITDPRLDDAGRLDLQNAIESYRAASDASDRMATAQDAASVTSHLEDGRYAMACVQARIDGRPLPDHRPPCFFDPRHGPSDLDVTWAPPGGALRSVPACSVCSRSLASGVQPQSREVMVGGDSRPYWQAGQQYGPYAGGYFGSFGAILPSVLIGTMLGNALFPPMAIDSGAASGMDSGGGFGGGDSGGGFGGGGFGDAGGGGLGDFGGGDF